MMTIGIIGNGKSANRYHLPFLLQRKDKIKVKTLEEKENIILTVGRLGTEAKNTELLLETLKEIDLKDWKVYLVGSIDKRFVNYKENFFKENPSLIDKIIFTGEIKDRKELYKYYNPYYKYQYHNNY